MYSIYDYAYNGLLYLNNMARPRHKRLSQLMNILMLQHPHIVAPSNSPPPIHGLLPKKG